MKYISVLGLLFCILLVPGCTKTSYLEADTETISFSDEMSEDQNDEEALFFVQISGAVKRPGVYQLSSDARVYEAIELAGGLTDDADGDSLNQALPITDGQMIHVLTTEESSEKEQTDTENGKVNINTADEAMLMTLPGIGESKAKSIISYRETKGSFSSIEDIMQITGIKEGVYQKIKDQITVGN